MAIDLEDVPILGEVGPYMTVKVAADLLGENRQGIYYLLRTGRLKGAKLDERTWIVKKSSVERYKRKREGLAAQGYRQ